MELEPPTKNCEYVAPVENSVGGTPRSVTVHVSMPPVFVIARADTKRDGGGMGRVARAAAAATAAALLLVLVPPGATSVAAEAEPASPTTAAE